ncbi:MAG: hypothetical protein JXL97_01170 [Bacteroidales bacterium]|nr:hypothetical protein [Bacteroidales bacterium]
MRIFMENIKLFGIIILVLIYAAVMRTRWLSDDPKQNFVETCGTFLFFGILGFLILLLTGKL